VKGSQTRCLRGMKANHDEHADVLTATRLQGWLAAVSSEAVMNRAPRPSAGQFRREHRPRDQGIAAPDDGD